MKKLTLNNKEENLEICAADFGYEAEQSLCLVIDEHVPVERILPFIFTRKSKCCITKSSSLTKLVNLLLLKLHIVHVYKQEYIIKERREYRTRLCSALNVCGESRVWNANYLTTISEYVIVYKRPRAFPS